MENILNGIIDTLKLTGQHNNLNNIIINAYETYDMKWKWTNPYFE